MKAFLILCWFLFYFPFLVSGQVAQTARAELNIRTDFSKFEVWPQPDSTVFVLNMEPSFRRNPDPFVLLKYNQNLTQLWKQPLDVPRGSKFLKAAFEGPTVCLLFEAPKISELILMRVHATLGQGQGNVYQLPERMSFKLTEMQVLDGYLFLTGLQNDRVVVLHLDPEQQELTVVPAIYDQSSALVEFQADTVGKRVEFILSESNGLKARLQIKRLAPDSRLLSVHFLQSAEHNFLSGRLTASDSARKLIAGTYSLRDLRYAQGFFTGPLIAQGSQSLQFHDFTTFSHFFDYMRPGRQEKLRRKIDRYRISRKTFQLRQRMLLHTILPYQNGFLLAGELYYPHYEGDNPGSRIFDGFQYSQVIVAAFDAQGKLQWENSFPLENVRHFELQQATASGISGQQVVVCYLEDHLIRYKLMRDGKTTPNELRTSITPLSPDEKALSTEPEAITHWYGRHFLTHGVQRVRGNAGLRTVYFLNKITF